jgi:hypothetical protein
MEFPRAAMGPLVDDRTTLPARTAVARRAVLTAWVLALLVGVALLKGLAAEHSSPLPAARAQLVLHEGLSSLPMAAEGAVSAALGADSAAYRVTTSGDGFRAQNAAQALHVRFDAAGISIRSGNTQVDLSLRAVGYATALQAVGSVRPSAMSNRVTYTRAGLSEWYANGPLGLEQGFTIPRALSGHPAGPLTLSIALSGDAHASLASGGLGVTLSHAGRSSLRYAGLVATDARGRTLHSWLQLHTGRLLLGVDTRGAHYPLRIDPLIQHGEKLTGSGEVGDGLFGSSVALSSDANTALIGAPFDNGSVGAAWVFTRSGSTWTQQSEKLTGGNESGRGAFGSSVALSGDGNTAVIGGPVDSRGVGAAWVFTRSGSTWTQQGEKLTGNGEIGNGAFGSSVALSSDGYTALIGGPFDSSNVGGTWMFTRSGSTWTQQGEKLTGSGEIGEGGFGFSVALSSDGDTALIGGEGDNSSVGAAWMFTRSGSTWTQQGEKLTGSGEIGEGGFGFSVALSSDGDTALIGGEGDNSSVGAAWMFTRSGSTWTQQGEKLTGSTGSDKAFFGYSVALSSDGDTALIGGHDYADVGAAWVFKRSGSTWTHEGEHLAGSGEIGFGSFGSSVALSSDGNTALIGGHGDNDFVGAAWVFVNVPSPTVRGLSPHAGPQAGVTPVTITGTNYIGATGVSFGSSSATSFTVNSATSITAVSPAEPEGRVDVTVTTPNGTSAISSKDRYRFTPTVTNASPNTASTAGGTTVTVTGAGLVPGTARTNFRFGSTHAKSVNCTSTTTCIVVAPAHEAGTVDVKALVSKVSSPKNPPADQFTYK